MWYLRLLECHSLSLLAEQAIGKRPEKENRKRDREREKEGERQLRVPVTQG